MTWYECKLIALQKMFSVEGREIVEDTSTREYLAGMPHAANEAMRMLATVGRGLIRELDILQNPPQNVMVESRPSEDGALLLSGAGGHSWVFEAAGPAVCTVMVGEAVVDVVDIPDNGRFELYRGLVENSGGEDLTLAFTSEYPFMVRHAGIYWEKYPEVAKVPQAAEWIRYDLAALTDDFYMLKPDDLVYEGKHYRKGEFFRFEGDDVLVLARDKAGAYKVYYYAYPLTLDEETPDDVLLPMSPEENSLIPMYMASELYKDDDLSIATTYRNEFEVGLERLRSSDKEQGQERFESGWI